MIEKFLRWLIPHDDIGWKDIGERFTRYNIVKSRWFNVYLHQMWAPIAPPLCHDHPWSFVTFILKGGYLETCDNATWVHRKPGQVLYRPAEFAHTVKTTGVYSWSLVITGPFKRRWANRDCKTKTIVA